MKADIETGRMFAELFMLERPLFAGQLGPR